MNFLSQGYASFRTNSIFIRIFFAVTGLVLGSIVVVAFFSYKNATSLIIAEAKSNNMLVLEQAQQTINGEVESIQFISLQTVMDRNINRALYYTQSASYLQPEVYRDGMSYLNTIESNHEYINDIWIYFDKSQIVLTPQGKYHTELFFDDLCKPYKLDWAEEFSKTGFRLVGRVEVEGGSPMIMFMDSLPIDLSKPKGTLVFGLSDDLFRERFGEPQEGKILANYVMDAEGNLLYTNDALYADTDDYQLFQHVLDSSLPRLEDSEGTLDIICEGKPFTIQYTRTGSTGWTYLSIMPTSYIYEKAGSIRKITILIAVISIILSITLAWLIVSRLYNPVSKILNYVSIVSSGSLGSHHQESKNELVFINKIIRNVFQQNKTLQDSMTKSRPFLQDKYLNDLVTGAVISRDYQALGKEIGIHFPFPNFQVMAFEFEEDPSEPLRNHRMPDRSLLATLEQIAKDTLGENCKCYFFLKDDRTIISVMNLEPEFYEISGLNEYLRRVHEYLEVNWDAVFTIGIGKCYENAENCCQSFDDALKAIEYKEIKGRNAVIHIDEVNAITSQDFEYPIETEMQLMMTVKSGDKTAVEKLLREIFQRNFGKPSLSPEMIGNLFDALIGTAVRAVHEMRFSAEEISGSGTDFYAGLAFQHGMEKKKAYITQLFTAISEAVNRSKNTQHSNVFEKIKTFIDKNYSQEISLERVAQVTNLSTPYLSFIFKEVSGKNFVDYVNEFRVKKAKELLTQTPMRVSEVAEAVGYSNANVFSKAFKKYTGITPGQFRKL